MPDPHIAEGVTGGSTNASTLGPGCIGSISDAPDFVLETGGMFTHLSIMVAYDGDATLVVQRPDGTDLCNDDTEGLDPLVRGAFPAGTHNIWVGDYDAVRTAHYRLGISEFTGVLPSNL